MTRVLAAALAVMVAALCLAFWKVYESDQAGDKSRVALCQVLLFARNSQLHPKVGPPPTEKQAGFIRGFYGDLISLVEGCEIPKEQA